ncbi:MAG: mechanosensitive ion channel [Pirellulaceae bacterium]|nr:mechanosensitive ion channel [Pirellulaceae bacterium]
MNEKKLTPDAQNRGPLGLLKRPVVWQWLQSILGTVARAMTMPLLAYFVFVQLKAVGKTQILAAQLAHGLGSVLPLLVVAVVLRRAFGAQGLARVHLNWAAGVCGYLERALSLTIWLVGPMWAACDFLKLYSEGRYSDSLGRLILIASLIGLANVLWLTANAIVRRETLMCDTKPTIWLGGGRGFQMAVSLLSVSLAVLAGIGYRFAAEQLGQRIVWTFLSGLALTLGWSWFLQLWGMYRARLERQINPLESGGRDRLNELAGYATQVVRILNLLGVLGMILAGMQIWSDILPMRELLQRVPIPIGSGASLRELVGAMAVVVVAFSLSRNVAGLIELFLPLRLPLDKGGRFAITFVARYLIGLIGLIWASSLLGFNWDRVQWLAAGLTVGLGFGLQEVFANLVSGLIILIERPVRVGDWVSVNNISGTVTKMALRATTILDADRREWIVPNKAFITGDVMNWTLSDATCRMVFPVSVAHGCEARRVQQILLEVAKGQSRVLEYPEPSVVLAKIGPRSLDFELRVFFGSRSGMAALQTEINVQMVERLEAAGIEVCIDHLGLGLGQEIATEPARKSKRAA